MPDSSLENRPSDGHARFPFRPFGPPGRSSITSFIINRSSREVLYLLGKEYFMKLVVTVSYLYSRV